MTPLLSYHSIDLDGCWYTFTSFIIAPHICPRPVIWNGNLN